MKFINGWWWPDGEVHMIEWLMEPKNQMVLNGRPTYQGVKQQMVMDAMKGRPHRRVIDVGAHIGLWSFNFSHDFEIVEAFEPVAEHRECFDRNVMSFVELPPFSVKVNMHDCALGDREDTVSIRVNPTSSGDSWVKGKGEVPMKTLDSFQFEDVDLIKIDCEGYEEFVLRGAEATIGHNRPVVIVEQKRDMAVKFGLSPMGAVKYLVNGFHYKVIAEKGGDYILAPP